MDGINIRWAIRRDMPEILHIESLSFEMPWEEGDFVNVLRRRNCIGMVAENDEGYLYGFMIYELNKSSIELINIAVHPFHRRRGVGRAFLAKLHSKLSSGRRTEVVANVSELNLGAQLFLRSCGFRANSVIRNFDGGLDAYRMCRGLDLAAC